jgi:hypothetical protein
MVEQLTHLHWGTAAHETATAYVPSKKKVSEEYMAGEALRKSVAKMERLKTKLGHNSRSEKAQ